MTPHTKDALDTLIVRTLASISPDGASAGPQTALLGEGAVIDSVGFINLLVALEQNLGGSVDLSTSFMEHGDAEVNNPFQTVDSLAKHIQELESARV